MPIVKRVTCVVFVLSWLQFDSRALPDNLYRVRLFLQKDFSSSCNQIQNRKPLNVSPRQKFLPIVWTAGNDGANLSNSLKECQPLCHKWKQSIHQLQPKLKTIQTYLLPPISFQDTSNLSVYQHFRPRFMAKEAILGARIMMRIYSLLVLVGWIFETCSDRLPKLPTAPREAFSHRSPIHTMDVLAKDFFLERLPPLPVVFRLTILGPVLEEIAYRGVGFWATYWNMWFFLFFWSSLAGFCPLLAALWMSHNSIMFLAEKLSTLVVGGAPILEIVKFIWLSVGPMLIQLPLQIRILQAARCINMDHSNTSDLELATQNQYEHSIHAMPIPDAHKKRCKRIVNKISRTSAIDLETESTLVRQIQVVLLQTTRWRTSSLFAAAHVPCKMSPLLASTDISSGDQYSYLRKFWGVFSSSFLVESRLVSRRGTIWGACGAHMCFNALTIYRLMIESSLVDHGVTVRVLPLLLVVGHVILDWLGKKMEHLEKKLTFHGV